MNKTENLFTKIMMPRRLDCSLGNNGHIEIISIK